MRLLLEVEQPAEADLPTSGLAFVQREG